MDVSTVTPAALMTVSLFLKCKAADVRRGSDRGEWNVGAISHTHRHQAQPPGISVKSCCCLCLHLIHRSACGTSPGFSLEDVHTSQCQLDRDGGQRGPLSSASLGSTPSVHESLSPLSQQLSYWLLWFNMRRSVYVLPSCPVTFPRLCLMSLVLWFLPLLFLTHNSIFGFTFWFGLKFCLRC